ncbi:MAG TPA: DEAD/DEAH box helicase, partial [Candidatus Obscuribacterales bacterium]
ELLQPGRMLGPDMLYLQHLLRLSLRTVATGQFLPGLHQVSGQERAIWKPVLSAPERLSLQQMAQAMPAALRAIAEAPPAPTVILNELMTAWVDALVRRKLPPQPAWGPNDYDAWLKDLYLPDRQSPVPKSSRLGGNGDRAAAWRILADSLNQWERPLKLMAQAPFRLLLKLNEPEPEAKAQIWGLETQLQSFKDPSLRIPLDQAWKGQPKVLSQLDTPAQALKEFLLTAFGQACALFAPLEGLLNAGGSGTLSLDTASAWRFLSEAAGALEQAGFGLLLPAWWTRPQARRVSLRTAVKASGTARLNLASLLQIDWQVALEGETLSMKDLRELAALKQPLVQFRGQWRLVDAEALKQALAFLQKQPKELSLQELLPLALGNRDIPFEIDGFDAKGKLKDLLDQLLGNKAFALCPLPDGFKGTLRPYQERGWSWLQFLHTWGLGSCLADDMGLGKTPQTLTRILAARQADPKAPPVLLICPTTLVSNWHKEAARFTPGLKIHVHHGAGRDKAKDFKKAIKGQDLVISTYGLLQRDVDFLQQISWQGVVLDEAQYIKNAETRQAKAARALPASWRIALTGTPMENHVGDLWSLMEFLNPGLLGPYTRFKRVYQMPIQQQRDPEALAGLKKRIEPFMLRRVKTDKSIIADLPEKLEMDVYCPLTREQASLYQAQLDYMLNALQDTDGIQRKGLVLSSLLRFKQLCDHPALFQGETGPLSGRSGKLQRLEEMLTEVRELNEGALIFTQFAEMGKLLQGHLQNQFGEEVLLLTGETPKRRRDEMVERFQSGSGPGIFILSLKAGGTGLNLTAANHVFHFDRWWNPAVENQATDRAFRIGQTRQVQVHKLICSGTVEDRIAEMLQHKRELAGLTVGTGEAWLTELDNRQLHDLFKLDLEQAVSE